MARLDRALSLFVTERRLVDENIRIASGIDRRRARSGVARDNDGASRTLGSDQNRRLDRAAIRKGDGDSPMDLSPERALGNSKLPREVGVEASLSILFD